MSRVSLGLVLVVALGCLTHESFVGRAFAQEMRTWSDASGKFKIKGVFKGEKDGVVTLETEDGEELEIETKKLSASDQRLILVLKKEVSDNPFKSKKKEEDPFKSKGKSTGKKPPMKSKEKEPEPEPDNTPDVDIPDTPRAYAIQWNPSLLVSAGLNDEWKVPVIAAETSEDGSTGKRPLPPKTALPPKTDFFDKLTGAAISASGRKAALTYQTGGPGKNPVTRVVLCDLATGKVTSAGAADGEWVALAMHDDGKQVLVRSNKFGFGNSGRIQAWAIKGQKAMPLLEFTPFSDLSRGDVDLEWAEFVDDYRLAIAGKTGRIAIVSYPEISLISYAETTGGSVPALSQDRKYMAFCNGDTISVLDLETKEIIGRKSLESKVSGPRMAFSPTGKRLACVHNDGAMVMEVESGNVFVEIPSNGSRFNDAVGFPDDNFLFAGNNIMLDLENQLQLWEYRGAEFTQVVGDTTFMAVTDGNRPGLLMNGKLPHPQAVDLVKKAQSDPDLFVFKEGSTVKIDFSAIADQAVRDKATKAFTDALTKMKCTVSPNAALEIKAKVTGPTSRQVTYTGGIGTHSVQEWITAVEFTFNGKTVWTRHGGSNVPFFITLRNGQSAAEYLKSHEKPSYHVFENPVLPKMIQRPRDGQGPSTGAALGSSQVSVSGIR